MPKDTAPGEADHTAPHPDEKAASVRIVRTLRAQLGTEHGTVHRVAGELGYGTESVRSGVRRADIDDGHVPGISTSDAAWLKALEQENRELPRANEILKRAASFFGAELSAPMKCRSSRVVTSKPKVSVWYHDRMAMTLRLTDDDTEALRRKAAEEGRSMQEVALTAVRDYVQNRPQQVRALIDELVTEDAELLERLRTA